MEWSGGPTSESYEGSVIFFDTVFNALKEVKSPVLCYATDFCHMEIGNGGFGHIWGFVSVDPDSILFIFFS